MNLSTTKAVTMTSLEAPPYSTVAVQPAIHPVLVNLQLDKAAAAANGGCIASPSALDVLNHLLQTNMLAEAQVQSAHAILLQSRLHSNKLIQEDHQDDERVLPNADSSQHRSDPNVLDPLTSPDPLLVLSVSPPHSMFPSEPPHQIHTNNHSIDATTMPETVRRRHVALRIYYDGGAYSGLAENVGHAADASIERALWMALSKARLVPHDVVRRYAAGGKNKDKDNSSDGNVDHCTTTTIGYSRCGRTDKGVSAAGQVVALHLKSAFDPQACLVEPPTPPSNDPSTNFLSNDDLPANSYDAKTVWVPAKRKPPKKSKTNAAMPIGAEDYSATNDAMTRAAANETLAAPATTPWICKSVCEYAYDKILNNLLPPDIRVLGWCPVSPDFSARFSCTRRVYRYFFVPRPCYDIVAMRAGLQRLVGTHDFRNFCKMDVQKVYNFVRVVHTADIVSVNTDTSYILIVGQAFLWHQIRCIAHVLFLIGRKLEDPSIVTELLNVDKYPGKPSYPLADERPLVLHDCQYENLTIGYSVPNLWNIVCLQEQQWEDYTLAAARIRSNMDSLLDATVSYRELWTFCAEKLKLRERKKNARLSTTSVVSQPITDLSVPVETMTWREALLWLKDHRITPEPISSAEFVYTPLLERSKGTTYEEKVSSIQKSSKRREKYQENVVKKRKTKEEDAAFYNHMTQQGGHAI
jgi:tRNA pseudouridine38/39 synthase